MTTPIRRTTALTLAAGLCASLGAPPALASDPDDLPVSRITLYRSGVGSFVREGVVEGDSDVSLRFRTDQVNDILKSMVVLDLGGGRIEGATYGSKEPLSRRLSSFAVDISDNPGRAELLDRLRGARVSVRTAEGQQEGAVLGVERRTVVHPQGQQEDRATLSLVTEAGVWATDVDAILSFRLLDPELAAELQKAITALAEHRTDNVKTLDIGFRGNGARDVVVGYVHESPVWKTSYRLVLPEGPGDRLTLQGWAIVENTTEEDWENVRLSLVAGQPVSFVMDLYQPLFVDRPEVPVPTGAGARPRSYAGGQSPFQDSPGFERRADIPAPESLRARTGAYAPADADVSSLFREELMGAAMGKSVAAAASAETVGEVFQFTLDAPVSVGRQQSAMLPIISGDIEGRRVSIFSQADGLAHPMRGVEITNDTGGQLMPGPIAVYDGQTYAGDAQIGHVSRSDERLLAYAVDLDVSARVEPKGTSTVQKLSIVRGMLRQQMVEESGAAYHFESNDRFRERTLIVEHPKRNGWDLVDSPEPTEVTDALYRFEAELEPGGKRTVSITQRRTRYESLALLDFNEATLLRYSREGKASDRVVEAFREAQRLRSLVQESERRISELEGERREIGQDQDRIRSNMGSIDRTSELYARYMQKLGEQESRLEEIRGEITRHQAEREQHRRALESYLNNLDID
jgi:hypothetical protein